MLAMQFRNDLGEVEVQSGQTTKNPTGTKKHLPFVKYTFFLIWYETSFLIGQYAFHGFS